MTIVSPPLEDGVDDKRSLYELGYMYIYVMLIC